VNVEPVTVAGVSSPVARAGPEDAREAVVFVHGNPGSWRDWEQVMPSVAELARVVAPDMPGFGGADRPRELPYTVEGYARHLDGLLTRLGIDRAHLVLHDFGGPWGLEWAIGHRDRVGSVTLVNTGVLVRYRWHVLARIWRTPVLGELFQATTTRSGVKLLLNARNPKPLPDAFVNRLYDDTDAGLKRAVLKLYRATEPGELERRQAPALREMRPPALVVWGDGDPYLGLDLAERQREAFPDAQLIVLDGCGHWPMADDPARLTAAMLPFLREQIGG
jgi:pimeloyl-ACP methyl ester carboxylesterase